MGASDSKPEVAILQAVVQHDLSNLKRILGRLQARGQLNTAVLCWSDANGRTPLHLAAARNHYECARTLLEHGASPHAINPAMDNRGGTPLHEATRNKHVAMAEMLLRAGASPFQCNALGKTCLDEAVFAGSGPLLRLYETSAIWRGNVAIKSSRMLGCVQEMKTRYLVAVPIVPMPVVLNGRVTASSLPIQTQLWIYKDEQCIVPKIRVWLDGANLRKTSRTQAVLRLHSSHKQPQGDLYTRYERGYCIFLSARDDSPAAVEALDALAAVVNHMQPDMRPQNSPPAPLPVPAVSPAPPPTSSSSTPTVQPSPQYPYIPAVGGSCQPGSPARSCRKGQENLDLIQALPGESDSEFAARLAAFNVAAGGPSSFSSTHSTPQLQTRFSGQRPGTPLSISATPSVSGNAVVIVGAGSSLGTPFTPSAGCPVPVPVKGGGGGGEDAAPSAPIAPPPPAAPAMVDDSLCVICLEKPREAGYLHGGTMHRCVCRDCCGSIAVGQCCPLCRDKVERVVTVF